MHSAHHKRSVYIFLVEIVLLLHIYCTKVLVAKLYYSTYICQLWSGASNQISNQMSKNGSKRGQKVIWGI